LISKHLPHLFALLLILPQAVHGLALPHLPTQHTRHKINIASLQDTSTYASKQASISVSGTYGYGSSATITGSQTTINGNYASVQEQSGLKAGDNGFQIKVKGNTDLKGAVIEASDAAIKDNKNTLSTATLTTSEIHNRSDYDALSVSVSAGTGGVGAPMALNASDKDESNTRSGISGAVINITDDKKQKELTGKKGEATVASLNRDVATGKDTSGAIGNNLDVAEVQASLTVTQTFVQQANTFVASMATKSEKLKAEGDAKQKQAAKETDPERQQQLQAEAKDLYQQSTDSEADSKLWQPGGTYRQIATALTAAAGGNVTSGTSQFIQGAAVNYLQSMGAEQIKALAKDIGGEGSPAHIALHGLLACGGASAQGSDCGSAAMGASAGVVINTLLAGDPSKMTATQKENRRNLVATLVAGIAAGTGANSSGIVAATNAATIETENNHLSPKLSVIRNIAKSACDANPADTNACNTKNALNDLDKASKKQMDDLIAAGKAKVSGAYDEAQKIVDARNAIAQSEKNTCQPPFNCAGNYQPSAKENALAAAQLPKWGGGEATPMADPVTAYVLLRFGMATPTVSLASALGGAGGEAANQWLYSGEVNNYEKIAYNAMAAWATGPIAANLNGVVPLAILGGTTNAGVTAYNNSQQGSNDSVSASFGFGMLGGGAGVGAGNLASQTSSRMITSTIDNPSHNPLLGVLLTGPSIVKVPNQEAAAVMNMFGSTLGQAGVSAGAPTVPRSSTIP
jgi:hypothetical protein